MLFPPLLPGVFSAVARHPCSCSGVFHDRIRMPVLPAEPEIYPLSLFTEEAELSGGAWWVLHTRPRQEKSLARELHAGRIPFYLPQVARRSLVRGRVLTSHV